MLADLDLLLIVVYCIADDFLPQRPGNARRRVTDAEIITLCVAQAIMGIPSDPRFLMSAHHRLGHLFPVLPARDAFHKRRLRLSGQIEALIAEFARHSPGFVDDLLLVDSTPVECARSRETVKRGGSSSLADALANAADYGYCASHSRFFWGFRLHALFALDFRGKDFEAELAELDATIMRPRRKGEKGKGPHLAPIRQRIESIFWTCKDVLTLERHGARTLNNLRVRLSARFAALAAAVSLNHQLGRSTRSLACYTA